ncbi:hypothetical protein EDD36DRAFT_444941 [Exophiala viscosa]|uniref:BSD domain-containing protein n=1 Tax=Exophiala viscosa TaxID=2486360 RepID=A0AAN6DQY4_9EURO|nr:hypothetical protein EDD36DRAFT_444941 [Exophiala viscosa]
MDLAYDHIAEKTFSPADRATTPTPIPSSSAETPAPGGDAATPKASPPPARQSLQTEFQETFQVFSNSAWGAKLGGLWGNVRKQGETYYEEARKEAAEMAQEVEALRTKGLLGLGLGSDKAEKDGGETSQGAPEPVADDEQKKSFHETETFLERFKLEAAKRIKDVQKAEDAADEALLRFGTNIRNFLRDAVAVTPPDDEEFNNRQPGEVLFESKDPTSGKRVIHTSRFDAQLHVIHTTLTSFTQDPSGAGSQWDDFTSGFDIDKMTDRIATDLEKYSELRKSMEKLVPEKVEYKDFWTRYYFLRHVVEVQEAKRKELLKASAHEAEEVGWDEDSEDEEPVASSTPHLTQAEVQPPKVVVAQITNDSSSNLHQTMQPPLPSSDPSTLKPEAPARRSHDEKSVADSDASYDLVSGATSRAPGSPREEVGKSPGRIDESDEEDWE